MPERLHATLPCQHSPKSLRNRWASIPGVTFPEPKEEGPDKWGQDTLPDPVKWMSTYEASHRLHVSQASTRARLKEAKVRSKRARGNIFWCRRSVAALARKEDELPHAVPAGWVTRKEAVDSIGCSFSTLCRWEKEGYFRKREARLRGRRCLLLHARDVEARRLAHLREMSSV